MTNEIPRSVALFDFDGTLYNGHIWQAVMRFSAQSRYRLVSAFRYLLGQSPSYLLNRLKLASNEFAFNRWGRDLAYIVRGLKKEEVDRFFTGVADRQVFPRLRSDIVARVRHHQQQGNMIVLVSGAYHELLEIVGRRLGVSHVIGTRLERRGEEYTGGIVGPVCFGAHKVSLLNELVSSMRVEIDYGASFAYADHISDVPMLEMVGNPVAVYPDRQLRRLARRRGWALIDGD